MDKAGIAPGTVIGRWTVLDTYEKTSKGERKWLCRCECGTERYVLERSLKHGGSYSCGCLRKERHREAVSTDLSGKVFGELTVLHISEHQRKNGGIWWSCQCSCGKLYDCPATLLTTGKRTHCGCKTNRGRPSDISGQRFHRLTAEYMLPNRGSDGSVIWHCRCDCGNEVDIPYNTLVYTNQKSCGCKKKEHEQMLQSSFSCGMKIAAILPFYQYHHGSSNHTLSRASASVDFALLSDRWKCFAVSFSG